MTVSVIIITLDEVGSIRRVLEEIPKDVVGEVLVVDGHSTDGTPELVRKLGYKVIEQEGKGYGMAFLTGAKHAKGDIIILMDSDGSQNPKDIPKLLEKIKEGHKVVFASRYLRGSGSADDTFIRHLGNKIFTGIANLIHNIGISDSLFLFAAVDKGIFNSLGLRQPGFEFCVEVPIKVHKKGYKFAEVPSFERRRFHGKSKVNAFRHGIEILWFIIKERFVC